MQTTTDTSAGETISGDLLCIDCGYNLRTLRVDGVCPECGMPVAKSLTTVSACARWLKQLDQGAKVLLMATALLGLAVPTLRLAGPIGDLDLLACVLWLIAGCGAAWAGMLGLRWRTRTSVMGSRATAAAFCAPAAFFVSAMLPLMLSEEWLYLTMIAFLAWSISITRKLRLFSLTLRAEPLARSLKALRTLGFCALAATLAHGIWNCLYFNGWVPARPPEMAAPVAVVGGCTLIVMFVLMLGVIIRFRSVVKKAMKKTGPARSSGPAN